MCEFLPFFCLAATVVNVRFMDVYTYADRRLSAMSEALHRESIGRRVELIINLSFSYD